MFPMMNLFQNSVLKEFLRNEKRNKKRWGIIRADESRFIAGEGTVKSGQEILTNFVV